MENRSLTDQHEYLSVRSKNILRTLLGDRFTVEDVTRLSDDQILSAANAGKKTLEDIRHWLAKQQCSSMSVLPRKGPRYNALDEQAVKMRRDGKSYADIAAALGVSISRARQRAFVGARHRLQIDGEPGWGARVYEYLNRDLPALGGET